MFSIPTKCFSLEGEFYLFMDSELKCYEFNINSVFTFVYFFLLILLAIFLFSKFFQIQMNKAENEYFFDKYPEGARLYEL